VRLSEWKALEWKARKIADTWIKISFSGHAFS